MKNSEIAPLITDIKKLSIGYYLKTSSFERLAIKNGFGLIWQQFYTYIVDNRTSFVVDFDHKAWDCHDAFILLIEKLHDTDKKSLHKILFHTLMGFMDWNYDELDFHDIFEDLELIDFPQNWLKELSQKHMDRTRMILDNKKIEKIGCRFDDEITTKGSEILMQKKAEWIRLVEEFELSEVIKQILEYSKGENKVSLRNELINQSSRLNRIQRKAREGIIDIDIENLELNKINKAIIEIIDLIE